jgi:hypothetical protein
MRNHKKQRSALTQYYNYNIEIAEIEDRMQHIVGKEFLAFLSAQRRGDKRSWWRLLIPAQTARWREQNDIEELSVDSVIFR